MAAQPLLLLLPFLAIVGGSDAAWCVCKPEAPDASLQKTLDYACGAGADCSPVLQSGACYNPNTVRAHCSYAANSYYQRKGQAQGACDFSNTATLTTTDPSYTGCSYPATPSAAGTSSTPAATGGTRNTFTPPNVLGGLGPSSSLTTDPNHSGLLLKAGMTSLFTVICAWMALSI